ncbi:MAG: ABC transporter ATP-binding protein [Lachnospiraceae bacterium]|nr:ABC transporter ATP-binding protein [Lachnospiraceae bacterium]
MLKKLNFIFSKSDKVKIVFLLFIVVIGSFLELMGVSVFSPFIDVAMNPETASDGALFLLIRKLIPYQNTRQLLIIMAAAIIIIYVVKNIYIIAEKNAIYKFSYRIQRSISTRLLKAYMKEPYSFHLNKNISVLQRSMQEDTDQFTKGIIHIMEMIAEVCVCIAIAVYLFVVSPSIMLIIAGMLVVCLTGFVFISKRYSSAWGRQSQAYKAKIYQWMNQSLGGIKEIKVLNREKSFVQKYDSYFDKYVRVLRYNRLIAAVPKNIIELFSMMGLMLALIFKIFLDQNMIEEFIPQLAVFAVAAFRLLPSVGKINEHMASILYAKPSLDLIYHDLLEVNDQECEEEIPETSLNFENKIEVMGVSYQYPSGQERVIEEVSFTVDRGTTVAFVGVSGAGKSTMVDILLGLLEPQKGIIYADGMNIYDNLPAWQKNIGYIPQVIYLSDDSIRNNVAFGVSEEEVDDEAVKRALIQAQLWDFVDGLAEGMDTFVGDRGVRLSGGQRQRIGIARALYHNPEILVLDEATSALDNETENAVMEAIEKLQGQKTILIIAHRLTTISNADAVFEVGNGHVEKVSKEKILCR